jgi:hypothetical protein
MLATNCGQNVSCLMCSRVRGSAGTVQRLFWLMGSFQYRACIFGLFGHDTPVNTYGFIYFNASTISCRTSGSVS